LTGCRAQDGGNWGPIITTPEVSLWLDAVAVKMHDKRRLKWR